MVHVILFLCFSIAKATHFTTDYYHTNSIVSSHTIEINQEPLSYVDNGAQLQCASSCAQNESCSHFTFIDEACNLLQYSGNSSSLVEASRNSQHAVKIWSKEGDEPIDGLVPHFMIFHNGKSFQLEDWSLNPEKSPPITNIHIDYPTSPSIFKMPCGVYFPKDKRVLFRFGSDTSLFEWNLYQETLRLLPDFNDTHSDEQYRSCATSAEKENIFMYTGREVSSAYLYANGNSQIIPIESAFARWYGCAAFHPSNDNLVYIFGGITTGSQTSSNTASLLELEGFEITPLRELPVASLKRHACEGYTDANANDIILIAGGMVGTNADWTANVWDYNIILDTYTSKTPLPNAMIDIRLTKCTSCVNLMWIFSGRENGAFPKTVLANRLLDEDQWNQFDAELKDASTFIWAFPYNIKP